MELYIKPNENTNIIENITILYFISTIIVMFFEITTYDYFINIILYFCFVKTGYNIIKLDYNNYNYNILFYSILSIYQFIKPIIILYNKALDYSIMFNLYSIILNIASIKLIIKYKKIFATVKCQS